MNRFSVCSSRLSHTTTLCVQSPLGMRDYSECTRASQTTLYTSCHRSVCKRHQQESTRSTYNAEATSCLGDNISDTFISLKTVGKFPLNRVGRIRPSQTCSQPLPYTHTPQAAFGVRQHRVFSQSHFCLSSCLQALHQFFIFPKLIPKEPMSLQ